MSGAGSPYNVCMYQVGKARRRFVCCRKQESLADHPGFEEEGALQTRAASGAHILFSVWFVVARCWLLR